MAEASELSDDGKNKTPQGRLWSEVTEDELRKPMVSSTGTAMEELLEVSAKRIQ